jgi:hypothetical protein
MRLLLKRSAQLCANVNNGVQRETRPSLNYARQRGVNGRQ